MSQQPTTNEVTHARRRYVSVLGLFAVAWLVVAWGDICGSEFVRRLGFAVGGGLLVLSGAFALRWRRELRLYYARIQRGFRQSSGLIAFITTGWSILVLLIGVLLISAVAIR
jgi:hypothetical protein